MKLDLWVSRRGIDPAAETCATALRDLLRADVAGVERGELWRFDFGTNGTAAAARCERLRAAACRAGRYVNTNRDTAWWLSEPRPYPAEAPRGGSAVDVWVRDGDGSDAVALAWFRDQGDPELTDLRRGILWRLWLPTGDPQAARSQAEAIATTRDRGRGLLANPHAQTAEIWAVVRDPMGGEEWKA